MRAGFKGWQRRLPRSRDQTQAHAPGPFRGDIIDKDAKQGRHGCCSRHAVKNWLSPMVRRARR